MGEVSGATGYPRRDVNWTTTAGTWNHAGRPRNRYRVVFRESSVVLDREIEARTMRKAAEKAERMTRSGGDFAGFSVYSVTLL